MKEELPPAPQGYDETMDEVEARIRHALPAKFRFVRTLENAHPQIARLLREDDERREAMTKTAMRGTSPALRAVSSNSGWCY